jgi:hypothetical protein
MKAGETATEQGAMLGPDGQPLDAAAAGNTASLASLTKQQVCGMAQLHSALRAGTCCVGLLSWPIVPVMVFLLSPRAQHLNYYRHYRPAPQQAHAAGSCTQRTPVHRSGCAWSDQMSTNVAFHWQRVVPPTSAHESLSSDSLHNGLAMLHLTSVVVRFTNVHGYLAVVGPAGQGAGDAQPACS